MERKDEIIQMQNEIMQGLLNQRMQLLSEDLWGIKPPEMEELLGAPKDASQPQAPKAAASQEKAASKEEKQQEETPPESIENLKKELHGYIGLDTIKSEVDSLINWIEIMKARKAHDLPTPDLSLHMVFSGNPGTGKTMVARLMSRIYKSLGVLSKGHLIEVDRSGLVAGYVGQTAIKTSEVIQKAMGGVLFIDEAYALTNRGGTDYGQEAVDTLLKAMEDHREDLVVIVAGYTELMQEFIHSNPGLESRFNRFMFFPDYTIDEMLGIFEMRCGKSGYTLDEEGKEKLKEILEEQSQDSESFGNARGVRNLFERAISAQADRLASVKEEINKDTLMCLKAEDLTAAMEDKKKEEAKG